MKPATRTLSVRITAASLAAAGAIFGGLAVQMAHGHDPALGAGTSRTSSTAGSASGGSSTGGVYGEDDGFGTSSDGQFSQQNQSGGSPSGVVTRAS